MNEPTIYICADPAPNLPDGKIDISKFNLEYLKEIFNKDKKVENV